MHTRSLRAAACVPAAVGDIHFAAQNRLDAAFTGFVVKDDAREEVAVFGDGQRRGAGLLRVVQQFADAAGAIQQRVFGVQVEMHELGGGHGFLLAGLTRAQTGLRPRPGPCS